MDLWHLGRATRRGERMFGKLRLNSQVFGTWSVASPAEGEHR